MFIIALKYQQSYEAGDFNRFLLRSSGNYGIHYKLSSHDCVYIYQRSVINIDLLSLVPPPSSAYPAVDATREQQNHVDDSSNGTCYDPVVRRVSSC